MRTGERGRALPECGPMLVQMRMGTAPEPSEPLLWRLPRSPVMATVKPELEASGILPRWR